MLDFVRLPSMPDFDVDPDTKKGIFIVFLFALGAIGFLSLFDMAGALGHYLNQGMIIAFGWGKWILPVILLILGYLIFQEEKYEMKFSNYLGIFLFILSLLGLLFIFIEHSKWQFALANGDGGGYVGYFTAELLYKSTGGLAAGILLVSFFIISLLLMFNTTLAALFGKESLIAKLLYPFNYLVSKFINREKSNEDEEEEEEPEEENDDEEEEEEKEEEDKDDEDEDESSSAEATEDEEEEDDENDEDDDDGDKEEETEGEEDVPEFAKTEIKEVEELWWQKPTGIGISIPLSILDGIKEKPTSGAIEDNKEVIKRTLENFGIPVEMGPVSVGPAFTQYTLKPADGTKLSKITNLSNEIALALATHPIRIEAPIPNKALVGIEVPNQSKATVSLKEILQSKEYRERKCNTMIALGKDVSGKTWMADLARMPHLLVAGATNTGKSVGLNSIILSLMYQNTPDELRFILVDPKRGVELSDYNNIPYLVTPVVTEAKTTINTLKWCLLEMDRRYDFIKKNYYKNIQQYNQEADRKMPYLVVVIDELADLMHAATAKEIESCITRLTQVGRAAGIHMIVATQRPDVNVITGLIKSNIPARLAFTVATSIDSRTVLDSSGAEKLLGTGDMLYKGAEMPKPIRLQGAFVSPKEIKRVNDFARSKSRNRSVYLEEIEEKQKVPGLVAGRGGSSDGEDDMVEEAKQVILESNKASTTFLQRRLRIGYARAANILDLLEQEGFVGPGNGAKPREILVSREQYVAMAETGVSGVSLHRRSEAKAPEEFFDNDDEEDDDTTPTIFKSDNNDNEEENEADNEEENEDNDDGADDDNDDENNDNDHDDSNTEEDEPEEDEKPAKKKPEKKYHDSIPDKLFSR